MRSSPDSESSPRHLAIVGPTATGKSALAMHVARQHPQAEVISVDSMQVYRGMDIGTAKPSRSDRRDVRHHLLDLVDPTEVFTVVDFQRAFREAVADIERRGGVAIAVGGTGLYHRAAIDDLDIPGEYPDVRAELDGCSAESMYARLVELDPAAAGRIDPGNRRRIARALEVTLGSGRPFSSFGPGLDHFGPSRFAMVGLWLPRDVLWQRIAQRLDAMASQGLVDEVQAILADGGFSRTSGQALGYREIAEALREGTSVVDAIDAAKIHTRQFARRQAKWFERDPRVTWVGHARDLALDEVYEHAIRPTLRRILRAAG